MEGDETVLSDCVAGSMMMGMGWRMAMAWVWVQFRKTDGDSEASGG